MGWKQGIDVAVERVEREGVGGALDAPGGGRRATVLVQTDRHSYLGTLHVPEGRARVLDVLCDGRPFLNLTDVSTDGTDGLEPVVVLNKAVIHCLRFVGVPPAPASRPHRGDAV